MPSFEIKKEISLGNMISVGTILVAVSIAWANIDGRVMTQGRDDILFDRRVTAVELQLGNLARELSADRLTSTRLLTEVQSDVKYLRTTVDEIRESQ